MIVISISSYTVEPPCAITSCEQPPPMSDHLSKTPNFPSQNPLIKPTNSHKRPRPLFIVFHCFEPLVSDHLSHGMLPLFDQVKSERQHGTT